MIIKGNVLEKEIIYEENFLTGRRELTVDGVKLSKKDKKTFIMKDGEKEKEVTIKGSFLTGIKLAFDNSIHVLAENTWYDWILIFCPLLGVIFGIFCGAIGGGLSALFGMVGAIINATVLRSKQSLPVKIILCILVAVAVTFAWFMICVLIAGGINKLL